MTVYNYEEGLQKYLKGGNFLEVILENIYKSYLQDGDLAVDGGANRGRHTIPMAGCVGNSGMVIAIEAIPELAENLRAKVESLPVKVINKALATESGLVEFSYCVERDWRSGIHARKFLETMQTRVIEVESIPIKELVEKDLHVAFIKLDLEGGEFDALQGAEDILRRDRPLIVVEHGGFEGARLYGYSNRDYYDFLTGLGYTVLDLLGRPMTVERFEKPDVWYFAALDLQNERQVSLLSNFPAFLISATQEMATRYARKFSAG